MGSHDDIDNKTSPVEDTDDVDTHMEHTTDPPTNTDKAYAINLNVSEKEIINTSHDDIDNKHETNSKVNEIEGSKDNNDAKENVTSNETNANTVIRTKNPQLKKK